MSAPGGLRYSRGKARCGEEEFVYYEQVFTTSEFVLSEELWQ